MDDPKVASRSAMAQAVRQAYAEGQSDYSLEPLVQVDALGQPVGRIADGDGVIFCCRRGEREVQLTEAFTEDGFAHFARPAFEKLTFAILTLYHEKFKDLPVAFAPRKLHDTLGECVSRAGLRQLRVAESEKFAHVTYFFNGGENQPFTGQTDRKVASPGGVPFEQVPELSLEQVCEVIQTGIQERYDLIVANFANGDVIGHTANGPAKIECARVVDTRLGQALAPALQADYVVLVTADHGNLEELYQPDGSPHVSHTSNPVEFILIDGQAHTWPALKPGKLADIAPTILNALDLPQPAAMQGADLAPGHPWGGARRVLLLILDGWGIGKQDENNPIQLAGTPVWDGLLCSYPHCALQASGEAVGLQAGKTGNSEAGHMNIGAGRVVVQDDVRLDEALHDESFLHNEVFLDTFQQVLQRRSSLHLIGLLSENSSHGSIEYTLALTKMARDNGLENVYLHLIFDGRSTEPGSAPALLEKLEGQLGEIGIGKIVTGFGRSIALDRNRNYARTQRAFDALVYGTGKPFSED